MTYLRHQIISVAAVATTTLLLGACATTPPKQLKEARSSYQQAAQSNAAQYAPTELSDAKQALRRAEHAYDQKGDQEVTRTLSYVAKRRSQEAMTQGRVNYLVTRRKAKQKELFARTDAQRQKLMGQLSRQRQLNKLTNQQLDRQRKQLTQARNQLQQRPTMAESARQKRDQKYQAAIARLDNEMQRRRQAERNLDKAMKKLDDVASVQQEDGRGQVITLDNSVLFEVGKSKLLPNARQRLKQVADVLSMRDIGSFTIEGHTDSQGSDQLNDRLSKKRAQSVKDFLVSRGVSPERINTVGYGEDRPVASNDSPEGRAMNRRVEIVLPSTSAVGGGPDSSQPNDQQPGDDQQPSGNQQQRDDQQRHPAQPGPQGQPGQPIEPGQHGQQNQPGRSDQPVYEPGADLQEDQNRQDEDDMLQDEPEQQSPREQAAPDVAPED